MSLTQHTAKHLRSVYFGGNWSDTNLKDTLSDVTWQQATTSIYQLNTIATLVYHMTYYVGGIIPVLKGGKLTTRDKFSWELPSIKSQVDWEELLDQAYEDAKRFADILEKMPDEQMWADFTDKKYGTYFSNLHGIIEHLHYHLGQVVILKKLVQTTTEK